MKEYGNSGIGYVLTRYEAALVYCERECIPFEEWDCDDEYFELMCEASWADHWSPFTGTGYIIRETGEYNSTDAIAYSDAALFVIPLDADTSNVFERECRFNNYAEMAEYIEGNFGIEPRPEGFQKLVGTYWG